MIEEELFCKLFPEYTVNGRPLHPYFDLFESGYEQAENRIEGLEAQIEQMKRDVIAERDHSEKIEDIITCTVLNDILEKWEKK